MVGKGLREFKGNRDRLDTLDFRDEVSRSFLHVNVGEGKARFTDIRSW